MDVVTTVRIMGKRILPGELLRITAVNGRGCGRGQGRGTGFNQARGSSHFATSKIISNPRFLRKIKIKE
jgi:hypothetical protein